MEKSSNTEQRVAHILEEMRKALPEIKRQVKVYERNVQSGNRIKSPKVTVHLDIGNQNSLTAFEQ